MIPAPGQAPSRSALSARLWQKRHWLRPAFWALHRLAALALALAVLASLMLGAGLWRLMQGPVNLAWLARRLEAEANHGAHPLVLHIGQAALVWEGWRGGVDRPIDLRLNDVVATDRDGHEIAEIPHAEVSLALHALLLGHLAPRAADLDIERLHLVRGPDGAVSLFADARQGAPAPAALLLASGVVLDDLRRVRLESRDVVIDDHALGLIWRIDGAQATLARRAGGGFDGDLAATLATADKTLPLRARMTLAEKGEAPLLVAATLGPVVPASLADAAPAFAALKPLAAPLSTAITLRLGRDFAWRDIEGTLTLGPGEISLAGGTVPLASAHTAFTTEGHDQLLLRAATATLAAADGSTGPTLSGHGSLARSPGGRIGVSLETKLDRLPFADLARYWPAGLAANTRDWLTTNITSGTAHDGHLALTASLDADGGAARIETISGTLAGDDLAITWLSPLPPLQHAAATLSIHAPDAIDITAQSGVVTLAGGGPIALTGGAVHIAGLDVADQTASMRFDLRGQVADALALLGQKRLHLLDHQPFPLNDPKGTFAGTLSVALPLDSAVKTDDIAIKAQVAVADLHLAGLIAGRDLDGGAMRLDIDNDGLRADGTARLAGVPARFGARMDFTAGPPDQEIAEIAVRALIKATDLARLGFDPGGRMSGTIPLDAEWIERRNGHGSIAASADLTPAGLAPTPLGWRKAEGVAGHLGADLRLDHGHLVGIDDISLQSRDASVLATADAAHGAPWHLIVARGDLGATHVHGDLIFPRDPGAPYRLRLGGASLDLSGRQKPEPSARRPSGPERKEIAAATREGPPGAPFEISAAFDTVLLGPARRIGFLNLRAENDGRVFTALNAEGFDQGGGARGSFRLAITRAPDGERRVTANAEDAGAFFSCLAGLDAIAGGRLTLSGRFDDGRGAPGKATHGKAGHPFTGQMEIVDFRLRDAPLAIRVLQGMTVYGLLGQQPGRSLAFDRLVAPFSYQNGLISLANARMSNASLGFTAKGIIDLDARILDLAGTVVPAYFFNSLLGRIPLLGRLFSPERGGGVLAASYAASGPFDDPKVSVNPLTALTPGFTRDIFNLFNGKSS